MKRGILMSVLAFALFQGDASAALSVTSDLEYAQKVEALLKDNGVKCKIVDEDDGFVRAIYGTDAGDVSVLIDCEVKKETLCFYASTELTIPQNQIAAKSVIINKLNASTVLTKAFIDPQDGRVHVTAWTATDCIPAGGTVKAILEAVVEAAEKTVLELKK